MNSAKISRIRGGFTLIEMLVVIGIIALLAALLLPALSGGKVRAKRVICETQLQQIGIAFQSFSHDHNSRFPMQVSTNDGGTLELVEQAAFVNPTNNFIARIFLPLSGSLVTPNILICPSDTRLPATSYSAIQSSNISYFVGLNAEYDQPLTVLAGDGNLVPPTPLLQVATGSRLTWDHNLHQYKGNVLFSDGHVEEWKDGVNTLASGSEVLAPYGNSPVTAGTGTGSGGGGSGSGGGGSGGSGGGGSGTGGGNGGGHGGSSGGYGVGASGQSPASGQMGGGYDSHSSAAGSGGSGTNQPGSAGPSFTSTMTPNGHATHGTSEETSDPADTNSMAEQSMDVTNAPAQILPTNDDTVMSASDRKFAQTVRHVFGTSYILLLLALLAYLIYRIRRWVDERERKRRDRLRR